MPQKNTHWFVFAKASAIPDLQQNTECSKEENNKIDNLAEMVIAATNKHLT